MLGPAPNMQADDLEQHLAGRGGVLRVREAGRGKNNGERGGVRGGGGRGGNSEVQTSGDLF
jgi:hypothetical protein